MMKKWKFSTQYLRLTPRGTARQTIIALTLTLPDGAADHYHRLAMCCMC